jgi:transcriptional regulator with XRE-family HTH domain
MDPLIGVVGGAGEVQGGFSEGRRHSRMKPAKPRKRQHFRVGEKIRGLRKERNLTQQELASRIGIQQSDLCRMETGEYRVSLDTLFHILHILGVGITEFFGEAEPGLEPPEQELLALWRRLDGRAREEVLEFLRFKSRQSSEG